ncbi:MAG: hypothetical protein M3142_06605 [Bacteroidota bacterium]|nr:hypothetical protein [Bacteroidota bacterium]
MHFTESKIKLRKKIKIWLVAYETLNQVVLRVDREEIFVFKTKPNEIALISLTGNQGLARIGLIIYV